MHQARRPWLPVGMVGAVALVELAMVGSVSAWACVRQPLITLRPQPYGLSGAQVTVAGTNFSGDPVEIRWNGPKGMQIGSAAAQDFEVTVTTPPVPDGLYVIVAFTRTPDGAIAASSSAVFQVGSGVPLPAAPAPGASNRVATNAGGSSPGIATILLAFAAGAGFVLLGGVGGGIIARRSDRSGARAGRAQEVIAVPSAEQ